MAWYFRAVESVHDTWTCHRGRSALDEHPTLDQAIAHLHELAGVAAPAALFAHWRDGRVEQVADVGADAS